MKPGLKLGLPSVVEFQSVSIFFWDGCCLVHLLLLRHRHNTAARNVTNLYWVEEFVLKLNRKHTRVDNPGKSIGGHRSSTTVPSVAVTVFAVAIGGLRWAIGGPSMKGPQRFVTLVETAEKFYKHRHTCTDHLR